MVTYLICSELDLLSSVKESEPPIYYPNRCPKINIRPYLPPKIVYQYPNEDFITIESKSGTLSYVLNDIIPDGTMVHAFGTYISKTLVTCNRRQLFRTRQPLLSPIYIPEQDYENTNLIALSLSDGTVSALKRISQSLYDNKYTSSLSGLNIIYRDSANDCPNVNRNYGHSPFIDFIVPVESFPPSCEFIVKEEFFDDNGNLYRTDIRHQETRDVCPEVQQFGCETGQAQTINLKLDTLEPLLITTSSEFALQNGTLDEGFDISEIINFLAGNPDNCLLIWKIDRSLGIYFSIEQIAQICSPAGCPPPEYNYECKNCCRSCPPNTCAIECEGHVCCYESDGIAVESIPIGEYCNE